MRSMTPALPFVLAVVGVPLLATLLVRAWEWHSPSKAPDLRGAGLPELVDHLQRRGMRFHVVEAGPSAGGGPHNLFLTRSPRPTAASLQVPKAPEALDRWHGALYVERLGHPEDRKEQVALWGNACFVAGPFLFFGDPEMLAEAREALAGARF